jgi:hypothetical protein
VPIIADLEFVIDPLGSLKDPLARARQFIQYGLGQEKLQTERLKAAINEEEPDEAAALRQFIEACEAWINGQHYSLLQHVDIGSWSGLSARKMAEEADCLNLYDFAYSGWSHGTHSTWNHVGKFDVFPSAEPLHKHILQPANLPHGIQPDVLINATKYFDKLNVHLVSEFDITMALPPPNEWLTERFSQLQDEMKSISGETSTASSSGKPRDSS